MSKIRLSPGLVIENLISKSMRTYLQNVTSKERISQLTFQKLVKQIGAETKKPIFYNRTDDVPQVIELRSKIASPAVHVLGGSDREISIAEYEKLVALDSSIFFVQNLNLPESENVFLLPIGVEDLSWGRNGLPWNFCKKFRHVTKEEKTLVGPFGTTHSDRKDCLDRASRQKKVRLESGRLPNWEYSRMASQYLFVACPRGNGLDTHRFWETIYRGSIPVVTDSIWAQTIKSYKIPMQIITSWSELDTVSNTYQRVELNFRDSYLSPQWWKIRFIQSLESI